MVRKVTGQSLDAYLRPRLYDKIGIDADNLRWACMPDGTEIGGGGLFATTEDNLRLMKLYADGGICNGERILSEEFVRMATTVQNDSSTERAVNPPAEDNFVGYGFQIWMCRPKGVYRADGAMGQFTIVIPDRDMIIAINETAAGGTGSAVPQRVLDTMWAFLDRLPEAEALPEDAAASAHLARRMASLALPAPKYTAPAPMQQRIDGQRYQLTSGRLRFDGAGMLAMMSGAPLPSPVERLCFRFAPGLCTLTADSSDGRTELHIATDGSHRETLLPSFPTRALCSGYWSAEDTFTVAIRWIETCTENLYHFRFQGSTLHITPPASFFAPAPPVITAVASEI